MQHRNRWMGLVLIMAALLLAACTSPPKPLKYIPPFTLENIPGSTFKRITLTDKGAERIALQTAPVSEEQVARKLRVGSTVVASAPASIAELPGRNKGLTVRVPLTEGELKDVDRGRPASVLPLGGGPAVAQVRDPVRDPKEPTGAVYFAVDGPGQSLTPGQPVVVELPLSGGGLRKVLPYDAVIFDKDGGAWVYTNPEGLVFVRHPVRIDYVEGRPPDPKAWPPLTSGRAFLLDGPPAGTKVVTVGAIELWGAETGVGK